MHFCSMFWCISEGKKSPKAKPSSKALFGKVCRNLRKLERRNENPAAKAKKPFTNWKQSSLDTQNLDGLQMIFDWTQQTYARQFQIPSPFLKIQPNGLQLWREISQVSWRFHRQTPSIRNAETLGGFNSSQPLVPPLRFLASSKRDLITYNAAPWCFVSFFWCQKNNQKKVCCQHMWYMVYPLPLL